MADDENIIDVSEATFEEDVLQGSYERPVIVDFWAPWCGPCHMLGPILEKLAEDPSFDFVLAKVNVDENPNVSMRYRVQGIPAVKAFVDGQVAAEFVGAQPEGRVREFVQELIPNEADLAFREANSLLATRHWEEAEEAFRDLLDEYPQQESANYGLAKAQLAQWKGCEAQPYLDRARKSVDLLRANALIPLSRFLCRVQEEDDDADMSEIEAQYRHCARLLMLDNLEAAMDGLLDVLRTDKQYRKGEPRDVMLGLFELLGDGDPLTQSYRNELASVLF